jgi:hypothetical protein
MIRVLASVLLGSLCFACSTTVDLTVASTRNIEFSLPQEEAGARASKTDRRAWLLFLPLGSAPAGKTALTELLVEADADYARNVQVTSFGWSLIVLSYGSITVEADPWRAKNAAAAVSAAPAPAP